MIKIEKYIRVCGNCKDLVYHKNIKSFERAIKRNLLCRKCSQKIKRNDVINYIKEIVDDKIFYIKMCPNCNNKIYYKSKNSLRQAIRYNSNCMSCSNKGENNANYGKISVLKDKKWEEFRSKDSIKKHKEILKEGLFKGYKHTKESKLKTSKSMLVGKDVIIDSDVLFRREHLVKIGNHVSIDKGFHCTTLMELGDYIHIGPHVSCIGGPSGELFARGFNNIMAGARLICGSDRFDGSGLFGAIIPEEYKGTQIIKPIIMEPFSNIGTNAIVMPGTTLRIGVLITAGSLIIGDTEEWGIYKGNPAVLIKKIDGSKLIENAKKMGYEF